MQCKSFFFPLFVGIYRLICSHDVTSQVFLSSSDIVLFQFLDSLNQGTMFFQEHPFDTFVSRRSAALEPQLWIEGLAQGHLCSGNNGEARAFYVLYYH